MKLHERIYREFRKRIFVDRKWLQRGGKKSLCKLQIWWYEYIRKLAFLAYKSDAYQVRMYGVFLFGYLSEQDDILAFMRDEVSKDDNWRVQEVLAKAFDKFFKKIGYEKALPIIDEWLKNNNPNQGEQLQRDLEFGQVDHISKIIRMKLSDELLH